MTRILCAAAVLAAAATPAAAEVKLNALFQDGMVIQQGKPVKVFGTAAPGEQFPVRLGRVVGDNTNGEGLMVKAGPDGRWSVTFSEVKRVPGLKGCVLAVDGNRLLVKDILVGEVWVCSGQSNMEWPLAATARAEQDIPRAKYPNIRLFKVPRKTADEPQTDVKAKWVKCTPLAAARFSAVGYYFGRDLHESLDVPVGLIQSSWGGTPAEAWTSKEKLGKTPGLKYLATRKHPRPQHRGASLYNGMIAPLVPFATRGAIWYQGESNSGRAYEYRTLFPAMIEDWRARWGQGDFPFLLVQLAPFKKIVTEPRESAWAELREAQLLATRKLKNVGMAVITDYGNPTDIHPRQKKPVGERLARLAKAMAYGKDIVPTGPTFKSAEFRGGKAVLTFTNVGGGLEAKGGKLTGFAVAAEGGQFVNADAVIEGDKVIVSSGEVEEPAAVRYGWADCPVVNLVNREGLPATPFRTDSRPGVTWPKSKR